ncbi:MAG: RidA family protein [Betaproteobacteria bacterium]|nr:MAG: RidA family protein [Betaproteobacteria bacterium]
MLKKLNPPSISAPLGAYTHGIEISPGARVVHLSGQVGVRADGSVAEGIEGQLECAWQNIFAILAAAGMGPADIVKVTTYLTRPEDFKVHPRIRAKYLGESRPGATAVCVSALAAPEFLCEVEVIAAKA